VYLVYLFLYSVCSCVRRLAPCCFCSRRPPVRCCSPPSSGRLAASGRALAQTRTVRDRTCCSRGSSRGQAGRFCPRSNHLVSTYTQKQKECVTYRLIARLLSDKISQLLPAEEVLHHDDALVEPLRQADKPEALNVRLQSVRNAISLKKTSPAVPLQYQGESLLSPRM
jgi:hypothetical protein